MFLQNHFHVPTFCGYLFSVARLVYLAAANNPRLARVLARAGHHVFEAQTVSEVYFREEENVDAAVIGAVEIAPEQDGDCSVRTHDGS